MRNVSLLLAVPGWALLTTASVVVQAEPSQSVPAVGYNRSAVETARSAALGGGLRAFSNSIEALHSNPANMGVTRVYHVGGLAQFWSREELRSFGVAVVDSLSSRSRLAGGISVSWLLQDPEGLDRKARDIRGGLAFPLTDKLLVGVTGRYIDLSQNGYPRGVLPPSKAAGGLSGGSILEDITFDVGVTLRPTPQLRLAFVGSNLTDPGHSLLPVIVGGGAGFGTNDFTLESDLSVDFDTYDTPAYLATGGIEVLAANQYPLRVGYRWDEGLAVHAVSAGAGFVAREFSFDFGYRQILGAAKSRALFFSIKYHVESSGYGGR